MKYALNLVYAAAALDEICGLLDGEFDLTKEDLQDLDRVYHDLSDPDLTFTDIQPNIKDNLNLVPIQENVRERIQVLRNKLMILHVIKSRLQNIGVGASLDHVLELSDLMDTDPPF